MKSKNVGLVLIMLAACKGGDKDKATGSSSASGKGGCEITSPKVSDLVTTKTAGPIAPFGALTIGMSREDAKKACPNFFTSKTEKTGNFYVGEIVGKFGEEYAQGRLEFEADKLVLIELSAPPELVDALTAAWGPPKVSGGGHAHAWFDETKLIRAILQPPKSDKRRELEVSAYIPLEAFVEHEPTRLAWKPSDVLGQRPADVLKKFPQFHKVVEVSAATKAKTAEMMKELDKEVAALGIDTKRDENQPEFELPASPYSTGTHTSVILHTDDDGTVRSYGVWFRTSEMMPEYGWPTQSADLVKLFDAKWGPHKILKDMNKDEMHWFDPKSRVRVSARIDKPEDADFSYYRYTPMAEVWGAPGKLWGFEKAERPFIGSTPEEIKATYGALGSVKIDEVSKTVTLYMPGTEYDGENARHHILMFVEKGKIKHWRFNVPYDNYEPAKAEYEAALLTKLGKPGKEKYGETPYGKDVKVRWSDITKSLDINVGDL